MSIFIDILKQHHDDFLATYQHQLSHESKRAIYAMLRCRTVQQGCSQWFCQHCQHDDRVPMSCGHRHCPQCQHTTTSDWLARQRSKLLPVHYFMATFTLPYQLRVIAQYHSDILYPMMFKIAASVLKDFAKRQHKRDIGFTAVLHTHNRQRDLHPHLHIIVPSGTYDQKRHQWHKGNCRYLFNEFALAKVWRARLIEAIAQHPNLRLPTKIPPRWVVDCRHIGYGLPALKYLSRYLYRGVLADKDIIRITDSNVTFRYQNGQNQRWKQRTLPVLKFLWLILQHVLPKGLQRVRDYGFLRGNARILRRKIQLLFIPNLASSFPEPSVLRSKAFRLCPCCQHEMSCVGISRTR